MARTRYVPDRGLSARMGLTVFLLGLLYVALIALVTSYTSLALGLVIAGGALFAQWFFSDRVALYSMGGKEVSPQEAPELHAIIDRLCALMSPSTAASVHCAAMAKQRQIRIEQRGALAADLRGDLVARISRAFLPGLTGRSGLRHQRGRARNRDDDAPVPA